MLTTNLLKKDASLIDHSEAAMLAPANVVEMDTRKYVQLLSAAQRKNQDCSTVSLGFVGTCESAQTHPFAFASPMPLAGLMNAAAGGAAAVLPGGEGGFGSNHQLATKFNIQ